MFYLVVKLFLVVCSVKYVEVDMSTFKNKQIIQIDWVTCQFIMLSTKSTPTATAKDIHFLVHNSCCMSLPKNKINA